MSPILDIVFQFGDVVAPLPLISYKDCKTELLESSQIVSMKYDMHSLPYIKDLVWFTVKELSEIEIAKIVFKLLSDAAPIYITQMFQRVSDTSVRLLKRTPIDLNVPKVRSTRGQKLFSYRAEHSIIFIVSGSS